ncbi:MAG TPA: hypothetical protein VMS87_08080 [Roseiarcus sp.]|nr:hypothetical protein [Roseiarcus sp.]
MTTDTLSAAKMPAEHAEILALLAQRARSASVRWAGAALADAALAKGPLPRDELLAVARFVARSEAKGPDADKARLIATGVLNRARLETRSAEIENLHRGEREAAEQMD